MKKGILSVTGCALALGLIAAPAANASVKHSGVKHSAVTHPTKVVVKKQTVKKVPASKVKVVKKFLVPVNKNITRVNTNLQALVKKVDAFYMAPTTADKELDFYNSTTGKLKAGSKQLASYKKQLDQLTKKYGTDSGLTASYDIVSSLQSAINEELTNLKNLHTNYVPTAPASGTTDEDSAE